MYLPILFIISEKDAMIPPESQKKMSRIVEEKSGSKVLVLLVRAVNGLGYIECGD